ncbi:MAG: 50S ribosomal protein L25 [Planctomycetota bacterium]|jgi:large subunit ribosomal protein L25
MGKAVHLKAEIREKSGTKHAVKVRRQDRMPGVIYGHKQEPVAVSLNKHDFVEVLHHGHRLFDVEINGKAEKVMVKDLQYDNLGKDVIHVDLMRVDVTETVKVSVPIEFKGTAAGAHEGGIIVEHSDSIEIECKATDIPEKIIISVKELNVGENLHASDIELSAGTKLASAPEMLIAACTVVAKAKSTEEIEEEAPVAPEVIGEKKEEEGESSEEKTG